MVSWTHSGKIKDTFGDIMDKHLSRPMKNKQHINKGLSCILPVEFLHYNLLNSYIKTNVLYAHQHFVVATV